MDIRLQVLRNNLFVLVTPLPPLIHLPASHWALPQHLNGYAKMAALGFIRILTSEEMLLPLGGGGGLNFCNYRCGGWKKDSCEIMYVSRPASEIISNDRRKFYIAEDRKL